MADQIKKTPNEPNFEDLNPEIVKFAQQNGFAKQPLELFLVGQLTWVECLETIVLALGREFRGQQSLLMATLSENPAIALSLSPDAGRLLKALPKKPLYAIEDAAPLH